MRRGETAAALGVTNGGKPPHEAGKYAPDDVAETTHDDSTPSGGGSNSGGSSSDGGSTSGGYTTIDGDNDSINLE